MIGAQAQAEAQPRVSRPRCYGRFSVEAVCTFAYCPGTALTSAKRFTGGRGAVRIHRSLEANGVKNWIIDPASIEVDRRKRKAKTDRIGAKKMVKLLARHADGEEVFRIVRVP